MIIGIEERGSLRPVQARRKTGKENALRREHERDRRISPRQVITPVLIRSAGSPGWERDSWLAGVLESSYRREVTKTPCHSR